MKNFATTKLYRFLPLILVSIASLFLFMPSVTVKVEGVKSNVNLIWLLKNTNSILSIFLISLIVLPLIAGLIYALNEKKTTNMAIILFIVTGITAIFIPDILREVFDNGAKHYIGLVLFITFIFISGFISMKIVFEKIVFNTREMMEIAILVAFAIVLDFIKFFPKGSGGSINLSMLPLFIIALRFSFGKSFIANGIVYGLIATIKDGYGFHSFPFDYLIGYGLVAVVSLFRNYIFDEKNNYFLRLLVICLSFILAMIGRMFGSTLSSMIIYSYKLLPAITYNLAYIPASVLLCLVIVIVIYPVLIKINKRFKLQ